MTSQDIHSDTNIDTIKRTVQDNRMQDRLRLNYSQNISKVNKRYLESNHQILLVSEREAACKREVKTDTPPDIDVTFIDLETSIQNRPQNATPNRLQIAQI